MNLLKKFAYIIVTIAAIYFAARLVLPMLFFWSVDAGRTLRAPAPNIKETRRIVADVGLALPQSMREVEVFQEGVVDHTFHLKLSLPQKDLKLFTDQKLLKGKWQAGKSDWKLPKIVAESWTELGGGEDKGWRCWSDAVAYLKHPGQLFMLQVAISPARADEVIVYLKLVQT